MNEVKINMLILSGKGAFIVTSLAFIGAGYVAKTTFNGVCKIKDVVRDKLSKDIEEESD